MDDAALFDGPQARLDALLVAREARAERRAQALAQVGVAISISVVMPGPVKDCAFARDVARAADTALAHAFAARSWNARRPFAGVTAAGPEALWLVEGAGEDVKRATIAIEESHPLGRVFDLDVETTRGPIPRAALGAPQRRCLVCGEPARVCARAQRHSLQDLREAMASLHAAWERTR